MRGNVILGNCDITDPNFAGLGPMASVGSGPPPGTFSYKMGAGQLWRMQTALFIVDPITASGGGVCAVASFMTTPSVAYRIITARVRFKTNLSATGGPGAVTQVLLEIGSANALINVSNPGSFSGGTYSVSGGNQVVFGMGANAFTGGGAGSQDFLYDGGGLIAYGSSLFSQKVLLSISTATPGWVLTGGQIAVSLEGVMLD